MKKWLLISGAIALAGSIYLFTPSKLTISKTIVGHCNISAAGRCFTNISKWAEWWPKNAGIASKGFPHDTSFAYDGCTYKITGLFYDKARVSIQCAGDSGIDSDIRIVPLIGDSILIDWECSLSSGNNPFKKLKISGYKKEIQKNMDTILGSFKSFIEDTKDIYGANFHKTMSKDSTLVTMNFISAAYPTTPEIYRLIDSLKEYIAGEGAKEINYPMLNVSKINDNLYETTTAISVNRKLTGKGRIVIKAFVPWKMLEGEVYGGLYTIEKGFKEMQNYKNDNNLSIMALPFQSLITDRRKEQDTAKWVTMICAPIS